MSLDVKTLKKMTHIDRTHYVKSYYTGGGIRTGRPASSSASGTTQAPTASLMSESKTLCNWTDSRIHVGTMRPHLLLLIGHLNATSELSDDIGLILFFLF